MQLQCGLIHPDVLSYLFFATICALFEYLKEVQLRSTSLPLGIIDASAQKNFGLLRFFHHL